MPKLDSFRVSEYLLLRRWRPALWFFLITLLTYIQVLNFGFSPLDDNILFLDNLAWFQNPSNFVYIFSDHIGGFYRPVLFLSFMVDGILGAGSPFSFHLSNLMLHFLSAILFFYFLIALNFPKNISFYSTLIFIVHPINVQAVSWIPGRNDILLSIFIISSFIAFIKYSKSYSLFHLFAHVFMYSMALLSKENAIILPVLCLLYVAIFSKNGIKNKYWLPMVIWITISVAWFAYRSSLVGEFAQMDFSNVPGSVFLFIKAMIINTGKIIFPFQQSILSTMADTATKSYFALVAVLCLFLFWNWKKNFRMILFGVSWILLFMIIPTAWSSIDTLGEFYEHRLYLPLVGMIIMTFSIFSSFKIATKFNRFIPIVFITIFFVLLIKTSNRSNLFRDNISFAETIIRESPDHYRSDKIMGIVLSERGNHENSIQYFNNALENNPSDEAIYYNRGLAYYYTQKYSLAIDDFNKAIAIKMDYYDAYNNRGIAHGNLGNYESALSDFNIVLENRPDSFTTLNNIGLNYFKLGKHDFAEKYFSQSIYVNPNFAFAYNNRGHLSLRFENYEDALKDFVFALTLDSLYSSPHIGKALVYYYTNDSTNLQIVMAELLKMNPDFTLESYLFEN
jgi:protein O-mannosyl-transferase